MNDPVALAVLRHALEGVADEMGLILRRTALSPNIKERMDCSAAVFGPDGTLVAQAAHVPVHLGSMPASVAAALALGPLESGEQIVVNDPYAGGTHLNDITLVAPVHDDGELLGYVANRAHHTDVGGMAPGSMPAYATEIWQEGLRIPPAVLSEGLLDVLCANSRTPAERRGDLAAQAGANRRGAQRLRELRGRFGSLGFDALCDYAERLTRAALSRLPSGSWSASDVLDGGVTIRCTVRLDGDALEVDLRESDLQVAAPINAVEAVAVSAATFVLRCLIGADVPTNDGVLRALRVLVRPGTVVAAQPPAAVGAGNVECSQRICDVVFRALAKGLPDLVPAASQGTMNSVLVGGGGFAYYETVGGGQGAGPWGDGDSGVHTNMTNTRNTPVEALEHAYPLRVTRYELRSGSGGAGEYRGGDGVVRELEVLAEDATVTVVADRRTSRPWGLGGASDGALGRTLIDGVEQPSLVTRPVSRGTRITVETPGGGGWTRS